jgi:hypothetical protein
MTTTATAKLTKRAERAEGIALGMGFLLLKLNSAYADDMSEGMRQQVDQALNDYRQLEREYIQRRKQAESKA